MSDLNINTNIATEFGIEFDIYELMNSAEFSELRAGFEPMPIPTDTELDIMFSWYKKSGVTMPDENKHTYRERFEKHYLAASMRLSPLGGELSWSTADFELFKFKTEKLCIMFYPHQTSRGNYHVRFRKCGSGNDDIKMNIAAFLLRQLGINDGLMPGVDRFFKQHNDPFLPVETKQQAIDLIKSSNFQYKSEFLDAIENYKNTAVLV